MNISVKLKKIVTNAATSLKLFSNCKNCHCYYFLLRFANLVRQAFVKINKLLILLGIHMDASNEIEPLYTISLY